jgi:hypothetical protein
MILAAVAAALATSPRLATLQPARPLLAARASLAPAMRLDFGQPDDDDDPLPEPLPSPPPPEETGALSTWTVPPTAPANVRVAEAAALAAWIEQAGGSAAGVAPAPAIDDGVGLVATNGARRGDVLLAVPLSLGLSAESALRSSIGAYLAEFEPYLADYAFIALALLHERRLGEESALAPWLLGCPSLLPPSGFADLPLLWGDEGLASLAAATTAGATERMSDVRADFEWLQANVFATAPDVFPPSVRAAGVRATQAVARAALRASSMTHAVMPLAPRRVRRPSPLRPMRPQWRRRSRALSPSPPTVTSTMHGPCCCRCSISSTTS